MATMRRPVHVHLHTTSDNWEESKHPRRDDGKFGHGTTHERILAATRPISVEEAKALVAGKTEKPGGTDPVQHLEVGKRELRYGNVPLDLFVANEEGERYDGTVNLERARGYSKRSEGTAPPVIATQGRQAPELRIIDGGHRITAARLRGDKSIPALVYIRRTS